MDLADEIVDKKITDTACQALWLIRKTAREMKESDERFFIRQTLNVLCKLFDPGAEFKN